MDDNDLECVGKYVTSILEAIAAGQLRRAVITWKQVDGGAFVPELEMDLTPVPDAVATEP